MLCVQWLDRGTHTHTHHTHLARPAHSCLAWLPMRSAAPRPCGCGAPCSEGGQHTPLYAACSCITHPQREQLETEMFNLPSPYKPSFIVALLLSFEKAFVNLVCKTDLIEGAVKMSSLSKQLADIQKDNCRPWCKTDPQCRHSRHPRVSTAREKNEW